MLIMLVTIKINPTVTSTIAQIPVITFVATNIKKAMAKINLMDTSVEPMFFFIVVV